MALPRTEVTTGLLEELERFKVLIGPLGPAEWAAPSRCTGWTVADVAAHVIGGMADVASVVRCDATRVHRDGGPGFERHDLLPRRVEDPHHATTRCRRRGC